MWFSSLLAFSCFLAATPLTAFAQRVGNPVNSTKVTFNSVFDDPDVSTSNVTCASNLARMNATTFGGVQQFPFIGGTPAIAVDGGNSPTCLSCWNMTVNSTDAFIFVVAITHEEDSFQISHSAFNALTNEKADTEPVVTADVQLIDNRFCGLP